MVEADTRVDSGLVTDGLRNRQEHMRTSTSLSSLPGRGDYLDIEAPVCESGIAGGRGAAPIGSLGGVANSLGPSAVPPPGFTLPTGLLPAAEPRQQQSLHTISVSAAIRLHREQSARCVESMYPALMIDVQYTFHDCNLALLDCDAWTDRGSPNDDAKKGMRDANLAQIRMQCFYHAQWECISPVLGHCLLKTALQGTLCPTRSRLLQCQILWNQARLQFEANAKTDKRIRRDRQHGMESH